MRFGAVMADEDSVQADLLEPLEATVGEQLARLEGHVQVTVRATWREDVVMAEVVASDPVIAGLRERTREQPDDSVYGERVRLGQLVSQALEAKRAVEAPVLLDPVLPLATAYHRFYDVCRVLPRGDEHTEPIHLARLWLCAATRQVLANGLTMCGVTAPDRM